MLTLSSSEIEAYVNQLDKECNAIRDDILRVTWYMRGGVNYEQAMQLSYEERKLIQKIVKDNFEFMKKSKMPIL